VAATVFSLAFIPRNLRRLKVCQPYPLGDMLIALKRREIGAPATLARARFMPK
jgi:hypothetical protein